MLYTTFTVNDRDYKARLNAKACVDLEKKLGQNPLNVFIKMMGNEDGFNMPPLGDIITILWASLQAYEHGLTIDKTYELYDEYVNEGHTIMDMIPIIVEIFKVSGLLPEEDEVKNA